jgi:hypothetical protein
MVRHALGISLMIAVAVAYGSVSGLNTRNLLK